ncbi:MAG: quinone oxidoreductase family protein [Ktedonobacteraceae bacterium]
MKAIRIYQRGEPAVMKLEELAMPVPGEGEVLIKVVVAGINYSDIGQRNGKYPNLVALPTTLGNEVGGTIVAHGAKVTEPAIGTRVVSLVNGGYAEYALADVSKVVPIPDEVPFTQAIVLPIQGQTSYLLLEKAARFQKGERILIHAASGGVGSLVVQLAKALGAGMIIGTAHTPEKLAFIRSLGTDIAINTNDANWIEQVMQATQGKGVDVVLDAIGGGIGQQSIACLAPFGRMVVFGSLSNEVTPFVTQMLIPKCLTISGYNTVVQDHEDQMRASRALLEAMVSGQLKVMVDRTYPLAEVRAAHQAIEENKTQGKVLLTV